MAATHCTRPLILGSGPAGLTAAIYGARAGLAPIVVQGIQPGGQLTITTDVENYPGFADVIQGPWLMEQMQKQAEHVGAQMDMGPYRRGRPVAAAVPDARRQRHVYLGDSLVIATGAQAKWLNLPSEEHLKGKGVSACATCDGFFYRGKKVAVIGGGNTAVEEALYMTNHSHDVTLIHRRDHLRAEKILQDRLFAHPDIKVMWNREVAEFVAGGEPEGLVAVDLRDTVTGAIERFDVEGAFVAIGHSPATELFKGQLELDGRLYPGRAGHEPDLDPGRVRLRRRDGQDLPPGGDRRRHRLHGRAGRREVPRRGRFRGRSRSERWRKLGVRESGLGVRDTPNAQSLERKDLSRIEQILRIERALDHAHALDGVAELVDQELLLAEADAVLAGARAVRGERAPDKPGVDPLDFLHILGPVRVDREDDVKIAVADVADNGRRHARSREVAPRSRDAFREAGNRHADVGASRPRRTGKPSAA